MSENGWPDASKPGVPLHPARDGWHWLVMVPGARPVPHHWTAGFYGSGWAALSTPSACQRYTYLGPCITPAEVAAREQAARREGMEAAAKWHDEQAEDEWAAANQWACGSIESNWHVSNARRHEGCAAAIRDIAKEVSDE